MARRTKVRNPDGAGSLETQIERLSEAVGAKGVKAAKQLVAGTEPNVIRLAFKLLPKGAGTSGSGFGRRVDAALSRMSATKRASVLAELEAAASE